MPGAAALTLTTPLSAIPAVGARRAAALAMLDLATVGRLLGHLPMRHEQLQAESTVEELNQGQIVSTRGEVSATRVVPRGRKPRFEAVLLDHTGRLDLVWFNQPYLRNRIHPGAFIHVQGRANRRGHNTQLVNPRWRLIQSLHETPAQEERLRPVYPASEAVPSRIIEESVRVILPDVLPLIEDHLSPEYRRTRELPLLADAYRMYHAPESEAEIGAARRRLAYDELLLLQLGVAMKRAHLRQTLRAPAMRWSETVDRHIRERIPFTLTAAQDHVVRDLVKDLASDTPTNRLIQGDVGSGKTAVALYAMLMAVASGQQAALMAPTEILAEQHFSNLSGMLAGSKVRIDLLTGATVPAEREAILGRIAAGETDLVIGTHALLTESVRFANLAVAIIDEQHRFGVHQRATLRSKGADPAAGDVTPHVLVMTATPIPRTLAITLFGDLDISVITGLPPGRQPITTRVVPHDKRPQVYDWLRERLDRGEQAYIVAPAIGAPAGFPAETLDGQDEAADAPDEEPDQSPEPSPAPLVTVRALASELEAGPLAGKRLALVHGRLSRATREAVMERFRAGQIDALIATTVIEVGVDVPNATTMIVESADRFGLAQLHQLRGRVGRGQKKSACILVGPLAELTPEGQTRLDSIARISDGFALAERDLEIRGPGELFGIRQSGMPPFKVADLARDLDLLKMARRDAAAWIAESPNLARPGEDLILRRLLKTHGQWLKLGDVG
jgi:ATP-dependent DNA helicase RecG